MWIKQEFLDLKFHLIQNNFSAKRGPEVTAYAYEESREGQRRHERGFATWWRQ